MRQTRPIRFGFAFIKINAVVAKVNSGEDDFSEASINQHAALGQHFVHRPAEHVGPNGRDDAITAAKQTSVLNFYVGAVTVVESRDPVGNIDHTKTSQQIGQLAFVGYDFRDTRQRGDGFWFAGRVTAHHDDSRVGVVAVHPANDLPALGVAFAGNRASVDDTKIGGLFFFSVAIADTDQALANKLSFVLIDFATKGDCFKFRDHGLELLACLWFDACRH